MTSFVVYAMCTLGHMLTLTAQRKAAGLGTLRVDNSEWYGISSHDTQDKAQAWLDANRQL